MFKVKLIKTVRTLPRYSVAVFLIALGAVTALDAVSPNKKEEVDGSGA